MSKVTRRHFLTAASAGAATMSVLAAAPVLGPLVEGAEARSDAAAPAGHTGSLVAFVGEGSADEITLMVGTRHVVVRDRKLVSRLLHAAY